jgi:hypothetical protein
MITQSKVTITVTDYTSYYDNYDLIIVTVGHGLAQFIEALR